MKVSIRPIEKNDVKKSVIWRNIPDIWVHTKFKATREITLKDEEEWFERITNDPTSARFAIIADGVYVGNIYLTDILSGTAEYHIFIGEREYWGKGIARSASIHILDYAKNVLRIDMVSLYVKKENAGAYHLYSKLGFIETAKKDGDFLQMILYLDDWKSDEDDSRKASRK